MWLLFIISIQSFKEYSLIFVLLWVQKYTNKWVITSNYTWVLHWYIFFCFLNLRDCDIKGIFLFHKKSFLQLLLVSGHSITNSINTMYSLSFNKYLCISYMPGSVIDSGCAVVITAECRHGPCILWRETDNQINNYKKACN